MPGSYRRGKKRRMEKFNLGEISFVTRPAQAPAIADIQKSEEDDAGKVGGGSTHFTKQFPNPRSGETRNQFVSRMLADPTKRREFPNRRQLVATSNSVFDRARNVNKAGGDLVEAFTGSSDGHQHGLSVRGDQDGVYIMVHYAQGPEDTERHDHQVMRMADGSYTISENRGHSHELDRDMIVQVLLNMMAKAADDPSWDDVPMELGGIPLASLPEVAKASETENLKKEEKPMKDDLKKAQERIDELVAKLATAEKVASLPATHKAYYDALDPQLDDDARKSFIDASTEDRDALVKAAEAQKADADPVIYKAADGSEYRKTDDPRLVQMAKDRDEDRKESIRLRKAAEDQDLTKRADDLTSIPGDLDVRKALLKAVDGIEDEELRKKAHEAIVAKNGELAKSCKTYGTQAAPNLEKSDDAKSAEGDLDTMAKELAKKDGIDFFTAYDKVSEQNPDLLAKAIG